MESTAKGRREDGRNGSNIQERRRKRRKRRWDKIKERGEEKIMIQDTKREIETIEEKKKIKEEEREEREGRERELI